MGMFIYVLIIMVAYFAYEYADWLHEVRVWLDRKIIAWREKRKQRRQ